MLVLPVFLTGGDREESGIVTQIHHTTVMHWIKEAGLNLANAPEESEIPEISEIDGEGRCFASSLSNRHVDELQTFIGNKRHKIWIGSGRGCAQCLASPGQMPLASRKSLETRHYSLDNWRSQ